MECLYLKRNNFPQESYQLYKSQVIGRSNRCDIVLTHMTISKRHCELTISEDGATVYVEDLESGNGTYINSLKIKPLTKTELKENDQIGIGLPPDHICPNLTMGHHYSFKLLKRDRIIEENNEEVENTITIKQEIIFDLEDEGKIEDHLEHDVPIEDYNDEKLRNSPDIVDYDGAELQNEQEDEKYEDLGAEVQNEREDDNHEEQNILPNNINGNDILNLCNSIENEAQKAAPKALIYLPDISVPGPKRRSLVKKIDKPDPPLKKINVKRGKKSSKSLSPIKRVITLSQRQIRLAKLKEIANKQNEEKAKTVTGRKSQLKINNTTKEIEDLESDSKKDKTVVAKVTDKNRGSFLLSTHQDSQKSKVNKKQKVNNEKQFDFQVSLEENLTWSSFLCWIPCWSVADFNNQKRIMSLKLIKALERVNEFEDYNSYKRVLTNFLLIEMWNSICHSYEHTKKVSEYKFQISHPIENQNADMCIKIRIRPVCIKSLIYPKYGELLIIKFNIDGIDYTHYAIVKNIISVSNDKGVKLIELAIFWRNRYLNVRNFTEISLKIICNISYELSMLSALFQLNYTLTRDMIVSPKMSHFRSIQYDYTKNSRIEFLDDHQLNTMRKCFAAKKMNEPTLQLIDGLPGTGKTTLLCSMALEYLACFKCNKSRKKILLCSQTNSSVDMLLEKLLNLEKQYYKHLNLKIVRPGRESAMQPWAQKLSVQNLATKQPTSSNNASIKNIETDILLYADVIVTTLHWTTKLSILKNQVTWCLIDDASSANEPEILGPINLNVEHLVLCGNIQKTPNTILSKVSLEYNFLRSAFSRIYFKLKLWGNDYINLLQTQHRMHPEIMKWPNKILYFNTLTACEHLKESVMPHYRLFILPTNKNIVEPIVISRITWAIYELNKNKKADSSIVMLTQNLAQCTIIKKYMNADIGHANIKVTTFDQFEGNENDIVIVAPLKNPSNKEMEACFIHAKQTLFILFRSSQKLNTRLSELLKDATEREITVDVPPAFGTLNEYRNIKDDAAILKNMLSIK